MSFHHNKKKSIHNISHLHYNKYTQFIYHVSFGKIARIYGHQTINVKARLNGFTFRPTKEHLRSQWCDKGNIHKYMYVSMIH